MTLEMLVIVLQMIGLLLHILECFEYGINNWIRDAGIGVRIGICVHVLVKFSLLSGARYGSVSRLMIGGGVPSSRVAEVTILGILHVARIYHENGGLCADCKVEGGVG